MSRSSLDPRDDAKNAEAPARRSPRTTGRQILGSGSGISMPMASASCAHGLRQRPSAPWRGHGGSRQPRAGAWRQPEEGYSFLARHNPLTQGVDGHTEHCLPSVCELGKQLSPRHYLGTPARSAEPGRPSSRADVVRWGFRPAISARLARSRPP